MVVQRQFVPAHTRSRRTRTIVIVLAVAALFLISPVRRGVKQGTGVIALGVARVTHGVGDWFIGIGTTIRSKHSLEAENESLKAQVSDLTAQVAERNQLAMENDALKTAMGRANGAHFILASVLEKPPHSVYDTIVIDGGTDVGIAVGQTVFAYGETPIGTVADVSAGSAIVKLYSAPGEKTEARLSPLGTDVELVGRGGGNFETTVPQNLTVPDGASIVTRDVAAKTIAYFKKVTSDARDPFQTLLLVSPVNVNDLSSVEVRQ